ncbi:MAG TPA: hypothetical protein VIJ77_06625 [Candidatus Tumulicola sp.]
MRSLVRWVLPVLVFFALVGPAAAARGVEIGINYNWWKFGLTSLHECRVEKQPRSAGSWILPAYQRPAVRATVREQLRAMRGAGFTAMRIIVFYGHSSEADASAFTSMTGNVSSGDTDKLRAFVGDIAAAGFRSLEVVPDFGAENWLYCRHRRWGDCFDTARTDENWRFIAQITQTAMAAAGAVPVRVDIANEAAPDPRMPARTLAHAKTYLQTIAGRFDARFGPRWVISAARSAASPATETQDRIDLLVADLAAAHITPTYLELHDYSLDGNDMKMSLDTMQAIAERIGAHVILGELAYHSAVQASAISGWIERHPASRIVELAQWPEYDPTRVCAVDPTPPYTPGALGRII